MGRKETVMSRIAMLGVLAATVIGTLATVGSAAPATKSGGAVAARDGLIAFMPRGKVGEYDIWVVRPDGKALRRHSQLLAERQENPLRLLVHLWRRLPGRQPDPGSSGHCCRRTRAGVRTPSPPGHTSAIVSTSTATPGLVGTWPASSSASSRLAQSTSRVGAPPVAGTVYRSSPSWSPHRSKRTREPSGDHVGL